MSHQFKNLSKMLHSHGWIGVDLDGTLAKYSKWEGVEHIGEPVPKMLERVKEWLDRGDDVRLVTSRASMPGAKPYIQKWLSSIGLPQLPITDRKDHEMKELWDDRAVQVIPNTGEPVDKKYK